MDSSMPWPRGTPSGDGAASSPFPRRRGGVGRGNVGGGQGVRNGRHEERLEGASRMEMWGLRPDASSCFWMRTRWGS